MCESLKPRAISRSNNGSSSSLVLSDLSHEIDNILALSVLMLAAGIHCVCQDFCGGGIMHGDARGAQQLHHSGSGHCLLYKLVLTKSFVC